MSSATCKTTERLRSLLDYLYARMYRDGTTPDGWTVFRALEGRIADELYRRGATMTTSLEAQ